MNTRMKSIAVAGVVVCLMGLGWGQQSPATIQDAQQPVSQPQVQPAGESDEYERESISYVNALWLLDASTRRLRPKHTAYILGRINAGLSLPRFDYYPLPHPLLLNFMQRANQQSLLTIENVDRLMADELAPQIMRILSVEKDLRAANLLTEQQRNSFLADRAKELGITGDQMANIMTSVYLYVPVISHFMLEKVGDTWECSSKMGILWYNLSRNPQPRITLKVKNITPTVGAARIKADGGMYVSEGQKISAKEYAFRAMVQSGVQNLLATTQRIPEFQLSGQIVEKKGSQVAFDLGKREGIKVDDRYLVIERVQRPNGSIQERRAGWVLVTFVADTAGKKGYQSKAVAIGRAGLGNVLREYPRLPIDVSIGVKMFAASGSYYVATSTEADSFAVTIPALGPELMLLANMGRFIGISQVYSGFGFAYGWGGAKGYNYASVINKITGQDEGIFLGAIDGFSIYSLEFPVGKRFYFGKFGFNLAAALNYQNARVHIKGSGAIQNSLQNTSFGGSVSGGFHVALSPSMALNLNMHYQLNPKNKKWVVLRDGEESPIYQSTFRNKIPLNHGGPSIRVGLLWSPPGLPFSPKEAMQSMGSK